MLTSLYKYDCTSAENNTQEHANVITKSATPPAEQLQTLLRRGFSLLSQGRIQEANGCTASKTAWTRHRQWSAMLTNSTNQNCRTTGRMPWSDLVSPHLFVITLVKSFSAFLRRRNSRKLLGLTSTSHRWSTKRIFEAARLCFCSRLYCWIVRCLRVCNQGIAAIIPINAHQ